MFAVPVVSVTVSENMQEFVAGAVVVALGFPMIVPVTVVVAGAVVSVNPAQLPAFRFVEESVRFPVPGAPAVPALTASE